MEREELEYREKRGESSSSRNSRSRSSSKQQRYSADKKPAPPPVARPQSPSQSGSLSQSRSVSLSPRGGQTHQNKVLHVSNLSVRVTEENLMDRFESFGPIQQVHLIKDPYTKENRGFCFIYFEREADARQAMESMDCKEIEGKTMRIQIARRTQPREATPGRYAGRRKPREGRRHYDYRDRSRDRSISRSHRRHRRSRSGSRGDSRRRYRSRSRDRDDYRRRVRRSPSRDRRDYRDRSRSRSYRRR